MSSNPIVWFEIYVDDMQRAKMFYETVLATDLVQLNAAAPELWAFPHARDRHGASGALAKVEGMPAGRNSTLVYFSCEDCADESARITPAGGRVLKEKFSIGEYGAVVLAYDTEGNLFGLHSMA